MNRESSVTMPACTSCSRIIPPGMEATKFPCPSCGEITIWRCSRCRNFGRAYRCPKCGFTFDVSYGRTFACGGCPSIVQCGMAKCPKCGKANYLEEPLVYSDSRRRIVVLPRSWRGRAPHGVSEKDGDRWTRTFYGLDALLSFIAAEGNAPREYGDRVADQAQMIADMYYAVGESRCKCGDPFRVEREFIVHYPYRGSVAGVRARCVGCGEAKSFSFLINRVRDEHERAKIPIRIRA